MNCTACGAKTDKRIETRRYDAGLDEPVIVDNAVVRHCPKCGEEYIGIRNVEELHNYLAQRVARKTSKLTPREARYLRTWLGYSSVNLARAFDVTPETVSRWERVDKPTPLGSANERLLRLLVVLGRRIEDYGLGVIDGESKPLQIRMKLHKAQWTEEAPAA